MPSAHMEFVVLRDVGHKSILPQNKSYDEASTGFVEADRRGTRYSLNY